MEVMEVLAQVEVQGVVHKCYLEMTLRVDLNLRRRILVVANNERGEKKQKNCEGSDSSCILLIHL